MRITIRVDSDYTTPWKMETQLEFTGADDGEDDTAARTNTEERIVAEILTGALLSLDDFPQMSEGRSACRRTPRPEHNAVITTRITTMRHRHGLHLN